MHFLDAMIHRQFKVDKYLIGPSFRDQHQQAFTSHLNAGMPLLKDAFIACATLLVENEHLQQLAEGQQIGYKRAAAAMRWLRQLQICHCHELPMVLILGVALSTFALHHSGAPSSLVRYILGIVKRLYDNDFSLPERLGSDGLAFLICLIGTETEGCLILGRVPTIRIRVEDFDQKVDRFIGISAPMLTYFCDICQLAQDIRQSGCRRRYQPPEMALHDSMLQLEQNLEQWQPATSVGVLSSRFTHTEVRAMLSQAKVLRLTALLIIHRLQYSFGSQVTKAAKISEAILKELSMLVRQTGRSVPFAELAFLVACFELNDYEARQTAMEKAHDIVDFSPLVRQGQENWLLKFWAVKDDKGHDPIHWDDLAFLLGGAKS
ncbi:Fc.00g096910.m01.CDS01 [Cosmosporella sp. VM-42]